MYFKVVSKYWYKSLMVSQKINLCNLGEMAHQHTELHRILHAEKSQKRCLGLFCYFSQERTYKAALQQPHSWGYQIGSQVVPVRPVLYNYGSTCVDLGCIPEMLMYKNSLQLIHGSSSPHSCAASALGCILDLLAKKRILKPEKGRNYSVWVSGSH